MQFIFQIPIIDLRQSAQIKDTINVWPSPEMSKAEIDSLMHTRPFIRNFGKIMSSPEGYYCNINWIRYNSAENKAFSYGQPAGPIFNAYKHVYKDGLYTLKAELGFSDHLEAELIRYPYYAEIPLIDVLQHYLLMPVKVQAGWQASSRSKYWISRKLRRAGASIAKNYAEATSQKITQPEFTELVKNGEACISMTYSLNVNLILPTNAEKLDEFLIEGDKVSLYGYKWNFHGQIFKIWLFEIPSLELFGSPTFQSELQRRRSHLFRLHSEKETMRLLLGNVAEGNVNVKVSRYLKKTPIKIFRKERFSTSQDNVRNFALQNEHSNLKSATIQHLKKLLDDYGLANLKNLEGGMKSGPRKKTILFITSSPTNTNPIDFGEHFKKISEAWKSGTDRDYFTILNIETGVERDKVMEILYTKTPDFLHINLHASKINGLYFQDSAKNADPMPAEEFADYLKTLKDLKAPEAVILCACNSLAHAVAVKDYCKYAIGTNYVFPDKAGIIYAKQFYTALFNGKEVAFCHAVAVQGIRYYKPPFERIDQNEVYTIPQLIYSNQST